MCLRINSLGTLNSVQELTSPYIILRLQWLQELAIIMENHEGLLVGPPDTRRVEILVMDSTQIEQVKVVEVITLAHIHHLHKDVDLLMLPTGCLGLEEVVVITVLTVRRTLHRMVHIREVQVQVWVEVIIVNHISNIMVGRSKI